MCSENNDVAIGSLLLRPADSAWTKVSNKISKRLRASGI
jgi:hypothetical protein